jgi:hypothetical protein
MMGMQGQQGQQAPQQRQGGRGRLPTAGQTPESSSERFILEKFGTINTKAKRTSIDDSEFAWLENMIPIGDGNLRALYDNGASIYTPPVGRTIILSFAFNLAAVSYWAVFLDNGTAVQVRQSDGAQTTISSTANIFRCTTGNTPGCAQWGSKYLLIVCDDSSLGAANGYFIWDGASLFAPGTLQPQGTITNAGTGYTSAPSIAVTGGSGVGAVVTATVSNGSVTQINVTNPGSGYVVGDTITLTPSGGGGSGFTATITIMPFGVSGLCIEVYSGRIWIGAPQASPTTITFSAPNNIGNFSTASGGGSFQAADSFLRYRVVALRQSNGFLYYWGDSSINVISNVQTGGTPVTTTFNNSNVDPQVGTQWRDSIQPFGRAMVFPNSSGVWALYGGAAEKVSPQLDGIFANADFTTFKPSASAMTIYGIKCYMVLVRSNDPVDSTLRRYMCVWDGNKWFVGSQSNNPIAIALQELNSNITAWGYTASALFPMYSTASTSIKKWLQTKLWAGSGNIIIKQSLAAYLQVFNNFTGDPLMVSFQIDTSGASVPVLLSGAGVLNFVNNTGGTIQFQNSLLQNIFFIVTGYVLEYGPAQAYGEIMGATLSSFNKDFVYVSISILYQDYRAITP